MAQKAAKSLATRNTTTLRNAHLISLALNVIFLFLRFTFLSRSLTRYLILSIPAWALEFYLENLGRPKYTQDSAGVPNLRSAGQDLDAKGLTEYMWDVLYWTWINLVLVVLFGDRAWWLYLVVPGYSAYAIATTVGGIRGMMSGISGAGGEGGEAGGAQSNRQKKMEKRGGQGQRVAYR